MVATFLDLKQNRPDPANIAEKTKKLTCMTFRFSDCTQEQNGSPQLSSTVRQCKWPSMSRTIVEIQKFCYHGNLTSRFSLFLWVSLSFMMWTSFFRRSSKSSGYARQSFFVYSCPADLLNLAVRHYKYRNHFCVHHATDLFCPITITNWTIDVNLNPFSVCQHHFVLFYDVL